jgi:hypothetical protein
MLILRFLQKSSRTGRASRQIRLREKLGGKDGATSK